MSVGEIRTYVVSNFCFRSRGVGVWVSVRVSARVSAPGVPLGCSDCQFQRSGCGRSPCLRPGPSWASHWSQRTAWRHRRWSAILVRSTDFNLQPPTARDTCGQRRRAVEVVIMARPPWQDGWQEIIGAPSAELTGGSTQGDPRLRCGGNRSCTFLLQSRPPRRVGGRLAQVA